MRGLETTIDVTSVIDLADAWRRAPDMVIDELSRGLLESTLLLQRETQERTPVGIGGGGGLRGSITALPVQVADDVAIGVVGTSLAYAIPVELGTRPHTPPVRPLIDWAAQKFGVSLDEAERIGWAVMRKIARVGTEGAFMFTRAFDDNRRQVERILEAAQRRIVVRLAEAAD